MRRGWAVVRRRAAAGWARAGRGEAGNAMVEFVFLAVLLMVPLAYVVLTVFTVQSAAYAVSSAAREAGRVFVTTRGDPEPTARFAASIVMADSHLTLQPADLAISCAPSPCDREPDQRVTVTIRHHVDLPLVPRVFGGHVAGVVVREAHLEVVDPYRGTE